MPEQEIETSYVLSPSQQGMLYLRLNAPRAAMDLYQVECEWDDVVDAPALLRAWQAVAQRHPTLRTSFRWEGVAEPTQDVHRRVEIPLIEQDWQELNDEELKATLSAYLENDRREGFRADKPPLYRLGLFRVAQARSILVLTMHHALLDGRSLVLVLREVFACYDAYMSGTNPALPELPVAYSAYAEWSAKQVGDAAKEFWSNLLKGFAGTTLLRVTKNVVAGVSAEANYGECEFRLSRSFTDTLRAMAEQCEVTLNTCMQAAWAVLLSRYSGEEDVVFGATRACRSTPVKGSAEMVGICVNTLPVRAFASGDKTLCQFLKELRKQHLAVRPHEHTPLNRVQQWSGLPGGSPLFDTGIVFHNYAYDATFRYQPGVWPRLKFRLYPNLLSLINVMAYDEPELFVKLIYDRNRMDDATMGRLAGHLQTLLEGVAAKPAARLEELPMLTEREEMEQDLWNKTDRDFPREKGLQELFEAQVARSPEAIAIVDGDRAMTYRQLNVEANRWAHRLQALGVRRGELVGIHLDRAIEMMVAILAIIKAGGAYLPLDAGYPQARLAFMLEDAEVRVLFSHRDKAAQLPAFRGVVLFPDEPEPDVQETRENPPIAAGGADLAYVIYTSGSTGIPKGVAVPQQAVTRLICNTDYIHLTSEDRVAQASSASFDAATFEIWGAWLSGAELILVAKDVILSPKQVAQQLLDSRITTLFLTTTLFNHIAMEEPRAFASLKHLLFGGEAVDPRWVREVLVNGPPERLLHVYGPTETTTFALWFAITGVSPECETIPIGKPIANTQAYVVDSRLHRVPIGVPGELCLSGYGLALGYAKRPELTAERFVSNPFRDPSRPRGDERLYRTGDLVRRMPDGNIEFLGRLDRQVKIRGFRVELGEIETLLRQQDCVKECAVVLRQDTPGEKRIVAYLVIASATAASGHLDLLRDKLSQQLPDYMVPAVFVVVDALPMTASGKVDVLSLPVPEISREELHGEYRKPTNAAEERLCGIWSTVLGVDRVGTEDDFFALGGDSILSIQVVSKARQVGLEITPSAIFRCRTIARLAREAKPLPSFNNEQGLVSGEVPLTPIQLWFFDRNLTNPQHFSQYLLLRCREKLDPEIVESAAQALILHHDALRMLYRREADYWCQAVGEPSNERVVSTLVYSQFDEADRNAQIEALLASNTDLAHGSRMRMYLLECGEKAPQRLLIVVHHLVVDGVSWRLLLEDFDTAYEQLRQGDPIALPPKTTSFKTWAEKLRDYAQSESLSNELETWAWEDDGCWLPIDHPDGRTEDTEKHSATLRMRLEADATRRVLEAGASENGAGLQGVLLAAVGECLRAWTGSTTFTVDVEGHGREGLFTDVDLSRTVGWFTTMYPVKLQFRECETLRMRLDAVNHAMQRVPHHGIGYGILRYLSENPAVKSRLGPPPMRDLSFNYLGRFDQTFADSHCFASTDGGVRLSQDHRNQRDHLLSVIASVLEDRLTVEFCYSTKAHSADTIQRLANNFLDELRRYAEIPTPAPRAVPLAEQYRDSGLSEEELETLLDEVAHGAE